MDHVIELGGAMSRFAELTYASFGHEPVPSCPGWTTADLATHLGGVHRWAASILLSGRRQGEVEPRPREPLSEWYSDMARILLEILETLDPDEPVENFARINERAAFWSRRQLHETTIHTVDASQALGLGEEGWPISPDLAADGVGEVLGVFFPRMTVRGQRPDLRGSVRLRATDTGRSWIVRPADDAYQTPLSTFDDGREVAGEISGTAVDLYLGLWHRIPVDRLHADNGVAWALLHGPTVP